MIITTGRFTGYCIVLLLLFSCGSRDSTRNPDTTYKLYQTADSSSTVLWDHAQLITFFHAPWEKDKSDKTRFQAYADRQSFRFRFQVSDSLLVFSDSATESAVTRGDRVELFFSADTSLRNYYCIEIAPNGRVLDYRASWYRQFDESWDLEGLRIQTSHTPTGYTVTGSIPLHFFQALTGSPELAGRKIRFGLFRAETTPAATGPHFRWYSWIHPISAEPDFHIPSAFGTLIF